MKVEKTDLRAFGLIWTGIFFVIFIYYFFGKNIVDYFSLLLFFTFLLLSLISPYFLYPFYFIWIKFGNIIGWINTRIIMFILFYFIFTPIGLGLKLFGKDLLNKKIYKNLKTYWIKREEKANSMKYQF